MRCRIGRGDFRRRVRTSRNQREQCSDDLRTAKDGTVVAVVLLLIASREDVLADYMIFDDVCCGHAEEATHHNDCGARTSHAFRLCRDVCTLHSHLRAVAGGAPETLGVRLVTDNERQHLFDLFTQ